MKFKFIAVTMAIFACSVLAKADNLVQNPNFAGTNYLYPGYTDADATGSLDAGVNQVAYWVSSGLGTGSNSQSNSHPFWDNGSVPAGITSVGFIQGSNSLSQTLTLVAGQMYSFSFLENARNCCGANPTLQLLLNGNVLAGATTISPVGGYNPFITVSGTFYATGTSEVLSFVSSSVGGDGTALITDVNVSAVPEPSSLALLGTGVFGIVGAVRRKLRNA